jgi:hypothetical protein
MGHRFRNVGRGRAFMASICYSDAIDRPLLSAGGALEGVAAPAAANAESNGAEFEPVALRRRSANRSR